MSNHTPLIRLQAARSAFQAATECCNHWDYEGSEDGLDYDCCRSMRAAQLEVKRARAAYAKAEQSR